MKCHFARLGADRLKPCFVVARMGNLIALCPLGSEAVAAAMGRCAVQVAVGKIPLLPGRVFGSFT